MNIIKQLKSKTMQKQKTIYHLIVDKSGSMCDCIENTITGFNEQVTKIQELEKEFSEQEINIGLTTFNHDVNHHFFQSPAQNVRKLNTDTYRPDGSTALLDAIGMTTDAIEREIKQSINPQNTTVVIVILTDGHENSSKSFKLEDIRKQISRLEETSRWTFTFMGATLDAVQVAESMAIKRENSVMFEKSNMRAGVFSKLSSSMESYMSKKRKGDNLDNFF